MLAALLGALVMVGRARPAAELPLCQERTGVGRGEHATLQVEGQGPFRQLKAEFFGFNLEVVPFQTRLWDALSVKGRKQLVDLLRAFAGAVYRYPGGTVSNHFAWRAAVGARRPARKLEDWRGPVSISFGVDEYLDFVNAVGGQPWMVANLYGDFDGEWSDAELAEDAREWARYVARAARDRGLEVLRWELGNELDRGRYQWSASKYSGRGTIVAKAVRTEVPSARFVAVLDDVVAESVFTRGVLLSLAGLGIEGAHHLYYDGPPGGPPVVNRLGLVCRTVNAWGGTAPKKVWITEHGRWPGGDSRDPAWRKLWPKTENLEAAVATADIVIGATQIPYVDGLFTHSLASPSGPWALFHLSNEGTPYPSAVYVGLRILRDTMLPRVYDVRSVDRESRAPPGRYDVRGAILGDDKGGIAVWAINRGDSERQVILKIPELANAQLSGVGRSLWGHDPAASFSGNVQEPQVTEARVELSLDEQGRGSVRLYPHSVTGILLHVK